MCGAGHTAGRLALIHYTSALLPSTCVTGTVSPTSGGLDIRSLVVAARGGRCDEEARDHRNGGDAQAGSA